MARVVGDVGIGEQDDRRGAGRDPLGQRPELAGPARRLGLAGEDGQALMRARPRAAVPSVELSSTRMTRKFPA